MPLTNTWLFPLKSNRIWNVSSRLTVAFVGSMSKLWLEWLNTLKVHNRSQIDDLVAKRPNNRGLVTVSNHYCCIDDPILWGMLKLKYAWQQDGLRWTLAAEDICYTKYWHALFFSLGRCVPVRRGIGVYQRSMDFMIDKLHAGQWVHMFPEGKVNEEQKSMRLKWGVGRLIADCKIPPVVLPLFHFGMDDILPNKRPYIPRIKKKVTVLIGNPMDLQLEIKHLRELKKTPREIRKRITDIVQEELARLKEKAEILHQQHLNGSK